MNRLNNSILLQFVYLIPISIAQSRKCAFAEENSTVQSNRLTFITTPVTQSYCSFLCEDLFITFPTVSPSPLTVSRCCYDPNLGDSCGVTPLMDAVRGNHVTMTEFLLHKYGVSAIPYHLANTYLSLHKPKYLGMNTELVSWYRNITTKFFSMIVQPSGSKCIAFLSFHLSLLCEG